MLSRETDPATLPLCSDAIKDGLPTETGATLKIFNYADYVGPDAIKAFEKQYNCKVQVTEFDSMDEAVSKLQANTAKFDITNVSPDRIGTLVATEDMQPINHSYIPNFTNVWPSLQSPFYDKGSRYSIPYTLYTTGVGYRVDKIDPADDPFKMAGRHRPPLQAEVQGPRLGARRRPRGAVDGAAATRHHRREHRGPGADREGGRRARASSSISST